MCFFVSLGRHNRDAGDAFDGVCGRSNAVAVPNDGDGSCCGRHLWRPIGKNKENNETFRSLRDR